MADKRIALAVRNYCRHHQCRHRRLVLTRPRRGISSSLSVSSSWQLSIFNELAGVAVVAFLFVFDVVVVVFVAFAFLIS